MLGHVLEICPCIKEFNIMILESSMLQELETVIQHWRDRPRDLHLTLFERTFGSRGKTLVQIYIRGDVIDIAENDDAQGSISKDGGITRLDNLPTTAPTLSGTVVFSEWNCEYHTNPLSDYTASLRNTTTLLNPSALKAFTLNLSYLSLQSLPLVCDILGH